MAQVTRKSPSGATYGLAPHIFETRQLEGRSAHAPRQHSHAIQKVGVAHLSLAMGGVHEVFGGYNLYDVNNIALYNI
jgi:hypothetical protein